jgi:uncharacterized protein YmfQ (DUF2313 family)
MTTPIYTSADFQSALRSLMPTGRAWDKEAGSVLDSALGGLAPSYARNSAAAVALLADAFPATALDMLPEWEAALGLPDPCAGESPTLAGRRQQVVARLTNSGGQSIRYFVQYAASLGYTVTISQYAPFRCGQSRAGDALGSVDWFFTWSINAPLNTVTPFRVGQSTAGEPLNAWGNAVLECSFNAVAPAGTVLQFHYT